MIGRCHQRRRAVEFRKFLDSQVPRYHRVGGAFRPGRSPHYGQLRHPQDDPDPELVGQAPTLSPALHPHQRILAEPGGAVVCVAYGAAVASGRPSSSGELEAAIYRYLDVTDPWTLLMKTPSHLSGRKPPTRYWPTSPAFANELWIHDTRTNCGEPYSMSDDVFVRMPSFRPADDKLNALPPQHRVACGWGQYCAEYAWLGEHAWLGRMGLASGAIANDDHRRRDSHYIHWSGMDAGGLGAPMEVC